MTEKNYNPEQQQMKTMKKQEIKVPMKPITDYGGLSEPDLDKLKETEEQIIKKEDKSEEKKETEKKKQEQKTKRDYAIVNGISLPISTLDAMYISKFIKRKTMEKAISDLEEVLKFKRAIPMTGEVPHRKGKGMMSGRYPIKAVEHFIKMLKNLQANAIVNGVENGIIVEAVPNKASQPYGRGGAIRRKRTHVRIKVAEKKIKEKKK